MCVPRPPAPPLSNSLFPADRNVEKSVSIDGLSSADIGKQLEALVGKA